MARELTAAAVALALIFALPGIAHGYTLSREASSGKKTLMYEYGNWRGGCSSYGGVVKVLSKPQHGKLTPKRATITIKSSRYAPGSKCIGKAIQGFVVHYISAPGFRGNDNFTIEVSYPPHPPSVDTFTVHVK
jgi:hypothetical protein